MPGDPAYVDQVPPEVVVDRRHALGDDDYPRGEPLPEKADRRLQRAPSGGIVEKADHGVADQLGVAPLVHQLLLVEAVGERRHDVGPSHDHGQRHKRTTIAIRGIGDCPFLPLGQEDEARILAAPHFLAVLRIRRQQWMIVELPAGDTVRATRHMKAGYAA